MHRISFFWIFLNHLWLNFKSKSNTRRPPFLLVGGEPKFAIGIGVSHLQGTSRYFSPIFLKCSLCNPSSNLNLNGFRPKIIQYMAAYRDNSSYLGSSLPTRSPNCENWSGGVLHNDLGSHFTKNQLFCQFWTLKKWKIHFINRNSKHPIYESCWQWKDAHHCQKWGQEIWKFAIELAQT
jgi:hypothetical protein